MSCFPTGLVSRFMPLPAVLWLGVLFCPQIQGEPSPQSGTAIEGLKIKVDVEEVRLDVVVVDQKGLQIKDLTAGEFKIYQDRQLQTVTSARYISLEQPQAEEPAGSSGKPIPAPPIPHPELRPEDVRRTIAFIVDDKPMDFVEIYRTHQALRKYVSDQMQPGDLVSILKTSRGNAALQTFTSDKRELLTRIENISWSGTPEPAGRRFPPLNPEIQNIPQVVPDFEWGNPIIGMAVEYCIKALQDMPGRKYIMLISPNVKTRDNFRKMAHYLLLADAALRANIVIHTLNIEGLSAAETADASDPSVFPQSSGVYIIIGDYDLPFSRITGGLFLNGFNFFNNGLGDVNEQLKGYYLLSYVPPENTFSKAGQKRFHDIRVETARKGAIVHSRVGFFGNPMKNETPASPVPSLVKAMFSPFKFNALDVSLASGYIDNLEKGYLLPTWMHLKGENFGVVEEGDGSRSIALKAAASSTDIDGIFQDYGEMEIRIPVEEMRADRFRKNGINITVSFPVKKPGGYYVRVAVEDLSSGAKGSAYQFVEVPNLKKKRLALSSIYIIGGEEDARWIRSGAEAGPESSSGSYRETGNRNPAYKNFSPGDSFQYMAVVYNAKTKKKNPPDLQYRAVLYRNGIEFRTTDPEILSAGDAGDYTRIPLRNSLSIDESMPPGDYVLHLEVRDLQAGEKQGLATQTLDFRVTAP